ncbi:hypothetical protein PG994_001373 [Apiospora phragmitis]|uniref:Uncharacterized protein n=1 Tax=Apiospora phragmitis TaxID=2905665 RepID=A0ABR1WTD6_9PEZI
MATDSDANFKATHKFPHPYANAEVLRKYLTDTAGLKESQFRIRAITGELQLMLMLTDDTKKIDQDAIIEQFREAERQRKEAATKGLPKDD